MQEDKKNIESYNHEINPLLEAVLESTEDGILVVDEKGKVVHVNSKFSEHWSIPQELIDTRDDEKLLNFVLDKLADPESFIKKVQQLYQSFEEDFDTIKFKDGRLFERRSLPLVYQNKISGRVWCFKDVTHQIAIEKDLYESEQKYSNLFKYSGDAIIIHDLEGNIVDINQQAINLFGYRRAEFLKIQVNDLHPKDALENYNSIFKNIQETGFIFAELNFVKNNGTSFPAEVVSTFIEIGEHKLIQGIVRDITERKRVERIKSVLFKISEYATTSVNLTAFLKEIHHSLSEIIDTTNFYVALYDEKKGTYSFPYCVDEADDPLLIDEPLKNSLTDYVRRTGKPLLIDEAIHRKLERKGEVKLCGEPSKLWLGVPLKSSKKTLGVVVVQSYHDDQLYSKADLEILVFVAEQIAMAIEKKQAENLLKIEKAYLEQLFESSPEAIVVISNKGLILKINSEFTNLFGYSSDEVMNAMIDDILIPHDRMDENIEIKRKVEQGEKIFIESQRLHKDGKLLDISLLATPIKVSGGQIAIYAIYRDISEQKEIEQKQIKLRERLSRVEKMESIGVLAGGVAHDLNNMLGPLVGYPELILRKMTEDTPLRKQIQKMGKAAKDAVDIIQDLLTLARRGRYEMVPTNLNEVIQSYLDSHSFQSKKEHCPEVSVAIELDDNINNITGSSPHLIKVIMNLIINAFDAMPDGGALSIMSSQKEISNNQSIIPKFESGQYVTLSVKDTGQGIAEEDIPRIFEPYYSKKKMGSSGSGLGLSVVYGIVKDHKGYYEVKSTVGKGTEFILYFPVSKELIKKNVPTTQDISGSERILVVDDVAEQREMGIEILSSLGYNVDTINNGNEAIKILKSNDYDLVILDMIMEDNFDGLDTYKSIIANHPKQKAIIISGFSPTDRVIQAQKLGAGEFVKKPFTIDSLGLAVRQELDSTINTRKVIRK